MKGKKNIVVEKMTPKESHVYSKTVCSFSYDSFGVEHGNCRPNSYKHAIPSGLINKITSF